MRLALALPPPGTRSFDVVTFGLNSIDLLAVVTEFPRLGNKQRLKRFDRRPGGQAATAAVTCSRLGWRSRYIGRFGDDEHGRLGRESLEREGVDISASVTVPGASNQFAVILVDARSGERTICWDRDSRLSIQPDEVPEGAVTSGRVLLVDCHETTAATQAARYGRASGMLTVIDVERVRPGIADLLREIDVIIAAQGFPSELTGEPEPGKALAALADEFESPVVCMTLGPEGSLAIYGGREMRTPGFRVDCVDTTGAGDVFRGGFIAGFLAAWPDAEIEDVLTYANAVAALKCRAIGAREGIPRPAEVAELVRRQPSARF